MVARRLLAVLLVLLVTSTLAAVLVPAPRDTGVGTDTTTSSTATTRPHASRRGGRLVVARLDAGSPRPGTVRLRVGDQLSLRVASPRAGQVEVHGFGLVTDVGRFAPARFDLLAERPGRFPVRLVDTGRTVGRIVVGPRRAERGAPGSAKSPDQSSTTRSDRA